MSDTVALGPLLEQVVDAQRANERVLSYPLIEHYARALADTSASLEHPVLWPVGDAAQRLVGATVLISAGRVRPHWWGIDLAGERVLLVAVTAATPLALGEAAERVRAFGAAQVHACGVSVEAIDEAESLFDSYVALDQAPPLSSVNGQLGGPRLRSLHR
jgi:hypothetical protein